MLHRISCRRPSHLQRLNHLVVPSQPRSRHLTQLLSRKKLNFFVDKLGLSSLRPRSAPRVFPSTGFDNIESNQLVEEETLPGYQPDFFYPVALGEVFNDRFQAVTKLGYGSCSTIWLARDLQQHRYVALKVYIHNSAQHRERPFYTHLDKFLKSHHPGANKVRKVLTTFEVNGPHGKHIVLALQPSQMSIRDMDLTCMGGQGFDEQFVKAAVKELLEALDFLHTEVQCVHTDVHPGNLLLGVDDDSHFEPLANNELSNPVSRKETEDRMIYLSRMRRPIDGPLLLSDFGETRIGPGPYVEDIMPMQYRAPETLLDLQWSYAVDIWSAGLTAWDLLESRMLFTACKDGDFSDGAHFAELIAALGPPPLELLNRNRSRSLEYWDENGKWGEFVPIPTEKNLEARETKLEDKTLFLSFIRRVLTWDPNARPTARQLLQDPWLAA